ncbi:MAG: hypothetical protein HKN09_02685, partial [Saprospiraceae bacterium]|nr:hypothetical protein [Flavobacteriaceae bacterium]NNE25726.1 hypothetical protein [Saprospiraceae bacterium]
MSDQQFSDLHCHPAMHPLMLGHKKLWNTHLGSKRRKIKEAQEQGKRGGLYDQAGYPKLINSRVKLVYASLYSLEQGFMMNNSYLLSALNMTIKIGLVFPMILHFAGIRLHLRDFVMSLYTKYKAKRLRFLKEQEYWDEFINELQHYKDEKDTTGELVHESEQEIMHLLDFAYGDGTSNNLKSSGTFRVADGNWDKTLPASDEVLTVLTMEGLAIVSQTKHGGGHSKHGTKMLRSNTIGKRIKYLKNEIPLFFVTFSHHFSSELCGHARSLPIKARRLGLLDQEFFIDEGFSQLGYLTLKYLLSVKELPNGQFIKDENAGRRIFIDVKHLSLKGRLTLYQLVASYNAAHPLDKIPIIA